LPEEVIIGEITCESEVIPSQDGRDRTVSVLRIELDGHGDLPEREEE
jgi:DNA-binding protein